MNKLTKLFVSVISSVMIISSASAGDFSVTGGVKATYTVLGNTGTTGTHGLGRGLGITNEFTLGASGELDNGMSWSYAQDIDGATVQDDANITLNTDYGTVRLCVSECGLSTKYAFDNSAYGIGSDNGYGGGAAAGTAMQYGMNISSYNNVQYHLPADVLPFGGTFKVGMTPGQADSDANASSHATNGGLGLLSMTQYAVTAAPIDGLKVSASYYETSDEGNLNAKQEAEGGSLGFNYTMGSFSFGYGETRSAPALRTGQSRTAAHAKDYSNNAYSIGFAVNDSLSVSYSNEESEKNQGYDTVNAVRTKSNVTMEMETIDVAYTVGGMTLSLSSSETTNDSYNAGDEVNETIVAMSLAF